MDSINLADVGDEVALSQLGARLSRYRLNRNLTQAQLAHEAGLSRKTVSKVENGDAIDLVSLIRLLRGLRLDGSLDALLPPEPESPLRVAREAHSERQRARPRTVASRKDGGLPWPE